MGRKKQYRQKVMQHVNSLREKSLYHSLEYETHDRFVPEKSMAEIVAAKAYNALINNQQNRPDESIILHVLKGRSFHRKVDFKKADQIEVQLTPCMYDDIQLYENGGLKALQNARLCRMIEQAYLQNGMFNTKLLAAVMNMSMRTARERLKKLWKQGLRLPLCGMSKKYRIKMNEFRNTAVMRQFFAGRKLQAILDEFYFTRRTLQRCQLEFVRVSKLLSESTEKIAEKSGCDPEQIAEYRKLLKEVNDTPEFRCLEQEMAYKKPPQGQSWRAFAKDLRDNHDWSRAKVAAYVEFLEDYFQDRSHSRVDNVFIYQAVGQDEPPGKPLDECRMLPVQLEYYTEEELEEFNGYSTSELKWQRILRYTTQAKKEGALLNQSDLVFLLGVDSKVIRRLMQENEKVFIPTRGNFADIGPGLSHAEKIISLYLEGYTETQIKRRTGHSYESIENYIRNFAILVGLREKGLPLAMIRKVTGKSRTLIEKYKAIYDEYNTEEYALFMEQVRRIFRGDEVKKKYKQEVDKLAREEESHL